MCSFPSPGTSSNCEMFDDFYTEVHYLFIIIHSHVIRYLKEDTLLYIRSHTDVLGCVYIYIFLFLRNVIKQNAHVNCVPVHR